jgi:hypothetical protein
MQFKTPQPMREEHHELHAELEKLTTAGGKVGAAAQGVARALHAHFEREEEIAMPPLSLLEPLAQGKITAEMAEVWKMSDALKAELPRMLEEHAAVKAALEKLSSAAREEGNPGAERFAEKLALHAQTEEQVFYPATILVGEYLKLKLKA